MMKHRLFIVLALLISISASAQLKCSFRHYSSEDGLSQNTVMSIMQDHKGLIWLATWDGINKSTAIILKPIRLVRATLSV